MTCFLLPFIEKTIKFDNLMFFKYFKKNMAFMFIFTCVAFKEIMAPLNHSIAIL